jgi:hypothetical protein
MAMHASTCTFHNAANGINEQPAEGGRRSNGPSRSFNGLMTSVSSGCQLGPYELHGVIAREGMEVCQAHDIRLNQPVALRVPAPPFTSDSTRLARRLQDPRIMARLNHPNILAVYDVGSYLGVPFVVSELLNGKTLRAHIKRGDCSSRRLCVISPLTYL